MVTEKADGTLDRVVNSNGNPRKRNNIGIVSEDAVLKEMFGEVMSQSDFNVTTMSIDDLTDDEVYKHFYFVDIVGFDDDYSILQQIKGVREKSPDSEIVLFKNPSELTRQQEKALQNFSKVLLFSLYQKPSPEENSQQDYKRTLNNFVSRRLKNHVVRFLSQPILIKIGGSIFDLYDRNPGALLNLLGGVKELHNDGYDIILTTGGGPRQVIENQLSQAYGVQHDSKGVLERQAKDIATLLRNAAEYVSPEQFKKIRRFSSSYLREKIPIVSLSGYSNISEKESDTHTLRIGEKYGLYKVIFAKDTYGVYERDQYRKPRKERVRLGPISLSLHIEQDNRFFPHIYASQILNGAINRIGPEGKGEHLIESNALYYLWTKTQHLRAVQIINGTKPSLLRPALDGVFTGSYILKG